jgi:hypothetical protein
LGATNCFKLVNFAMNVVKGKDVRVIVIFIATEGAERALCSADVGVVDVSINDVCAYGVAVQRPGSSVSPTTQFTKGHLREQPHGLFGRESNFTGRNSLQKPLI